MFRTLSILSISYIHNVEPCCKSEMGPPWDLLSRFSRSTSYHHPRSTSYHHHLDNHHLCSARKSSIFHALQGWSSLLMLTRQLPYSLYILWGGPFILHIFLRALTPFHEALELTSFALSHISLQGPDSLIKFPCPQSTSALEALIPSWLLGLNSLLEVPLPSRPDSLFKLPLPSRSWFPPWSPLVLEVLTLSPQSPNSLLEANVGPAHPHYLFQVPHNYKPILIAPLGMLDIIMLVAFSLSS